MSEKITANIGFEKQIWDAACVLRGNIDASEYKNVVLGLIFLKYISDRFDEKYQQLVEEGDGFEEDVDEYTSEGIFFVPAGARWEDIAEKAHTPEIGTVIDDAMRAIEKENKRLKDILPKNFARPELDKRRLGDVVDLFTNIQMIEHGSEKDILGRTYEYCLSKFAEQEGKLAGEFYTPSCVVRTLVEVLQPYHGRVYDPCCGSGGMFVQSAKFVENHSGNINDISVYGQGFGTTTLEPISAPVWAYFRQLSGKEVFAAATTNYKEEVLFTVNYNSEITNTHVIRYNGVLYDITRVDTFEGYKEDITLYCCRRAR